MKKKILVTTMALAMAFATAMSGMGTLTVHATEYDDGCARSDREAGGLGDEASISINAGPSDSGNSSSGGGSSSSGSSYSGGGSSDSGSGYSGGGSGSSGSGDSGASYSAPVVAGSTAGVTGKENFRALAKSGAGTYKVTHKGIDIATFTLMNTESKKAVPCTAVALKQRADGKWAIDFQVTVKNAETTATADTTGLTVGAPLDRTYLYNTLGISYVTINDTVIIDIEAEAAAAK